MSLWASSPNYELLTTNYIKYKRPKYLTIICIISFIWTLASFPAVFSPELKRLGSIYPAAAGLLAAAIFISLVGVWHMKRWGVEVFTAAVTLRGLFFYLVLDTGFVISFLSLISVIAFAIGYKKMDRNL